MPSLERLANHCPFLLCQHSNGAHPHSPFRSVLWPAVLDSLPWNMEPCLFPTLDYATTAHPGRTQALSFSLCDERAKLDALQKAIGPLNLYELLWALVLRLYTGNETVAFQTQSNISNGRPHTESDYICSAVISKSQTVSSVEFRHAHVSSVVDSTPWDATLLLNTKVLYAQPKPLDLCVDKESKEKRILNEHGHVRLSTFMDIQPFAKLPGYDNGLVAVFNDWLGKLMLEIHFKSSNYTKEAILNVGNTCRTVFQSLLENPKQTIGEIRSLSGRDFDQILAWNSGIRQSVESTVHGEISRHVKNRPDAPALHAWDGNLTYDQLDLVSANLKSHLCDLGIRVGELVPVYFEKSQWAAVAMLGILKAGNKYHRRLFDER